MTEPTTADLLSGCGLPQAWAGQTAWRILDTQFDQGVHFLDTWQTWKNDPLRPHLLHYVAFAATPPSLDDLKAGMTFAPERQALIQALTPHWFGLLPGFHRLTLDGGRVLLTLCVGELMPLLRQQQFVADSVFAGGSLWNVWTVKALVRCCRRGTRLTSLAPDLALREALTPCGFEIQSSPNLSGADLLVSQFNPRWTIKTTRDTSKAQVLPVGTCAVIGAGLAGGSVAAALAKRGWQVCVLDQGDAPAAGASGLPVGLVVPHVSADDCTLSRLSRSGVRLMLQQARSLLRQGQDWDACGTLERRVDGSAGLPAHWPSLGRDWSQSRSPDEASACQVTADPPHPWRHGISPEELAVWHAQAAWLKPAELVRACLSLPGVTFQGNACISSLRQCHEGWELLDAQGAVLTRANRVVFANASGAMALLETLQAALPALGLDTQKLPAMHGMRGQLSWAMHSNRPDAAFPPFPVNGSGSMVPFVPVEGGMAWFTGSSYQPDNQTALPDADNHAANLRRLRTLIPRLGQALAPQFDATTVNTWKNTRCVTLDRLPVVGPLYKADNPSLWICAGMGSRGMTFSVLCAELLAARWGGEPLAVSAELAQSLEALRGKQAPDKGAAEHRPS